MTLHDERLGLAHHIADRLLQRHGGVIEAIGLHGSMARGPQAVDRRSDIDLLVVTGVPDAISEREVFLGDVFISMGVDTPKALFEEAGRMAWDWAIASDQFVNTLSLYDPEGFFNRPREVHERAVMRATRSELVERSQGLVMGANEWLVKADRCLEGGSPVGASICLAEGLIVLSFAVGLYTQTRWTGSQHSVVAAADAGRFVNGFSDAYVIACDVDRVLSDRLVAAHGACDALRAFFDRAGAVSKVDTVEELVM